jgi:hypothetical protein
MKSQPETNSSKRNDRIAAGLMLLAAAGAAYAFVTSIGVAVAAGPATQQVEWWRAFGFLMFTGIFVLLAFGPRRYPGLWELVILDKIALTITEVVLTGNQVANAASSALADGILVVILIAAYLLGRGYSSWKR